jgi:hypothetical protein
MGSVSSSLLKPCTLFYNQKKKKKKKKGKGKGKGKARARKEIIMRKFGRCFRN